ncbi:MAG: hypothetical protein SH868_08525 [Bythopirellula sp.]|nr:hypothetical protein [Bythopirellula sp.]
MRYLVKARVKPGRETALLRAIEEGTLGQGSVAGDEYLRNMRQARLLADGATTWVEVCYCSEPLDEELPYWREYFDEIVIKDAHARKNCRDLSGSEPWACGGCDCTRRLEGKMAAWGAPFLVALTRQSSV